MTEQAFKVGDRVSHRDYPLTHGEVYDRSPTCNGLMVKWLHCQTQSGNAADVTPWPEYELVLVSRPDVDPGSHAPTQTPAPSAPTSEVTQGSQAPRCKLCHGPATLAYIGLFSAEPSRCIREGGCLATREPPESAVFPWGCINSGKESGWAVVTDRTPALRGRYYAARDLAISAWRTALLERAKREAGK